MSQLRHAHILSLMSIAAAAFGVSAGAELKTTLIMAGILAGCAIATVVVEMRAGARPAVAGTAPAARGSMLQTKRLLMLMMVIGIVVYGGGAGTFATFSAETQNSGSSVSSGTLTMSDTVTNGGTATACFSNSSLTKDNTNDSALGQSNACGQVLKLQNVAPGIVGGYAKLDIANTGSIDASALNMFAPYVNGTLSTGITHGVANAFTTITLASPGIEGPITAGDTLEIDYGGSKITMFAYASYDPTTTGPISVSCAAPPTAQCSVSSATADFPAGSRVLDTSTESAGKPTNCFDQRTTSTDLPNTLTGAKVGTDLNFNGTEVDPTTHWISTNPFCKAALLFVQEQTVIGGTTYHYCWYGDGAVGTQDATLTGQCRMPISVSFTGPQTMTTSATATPYTVSATGLQGNIVANDSIKISELGVATDTCTAAANAYPGDTSISLKSCTAATAFTTAATITDYTTTFNMNSDQTDTLSNFDTGWPASNLQELPTLVADGTKAPTGATVTQVELGKYGSTGTVGGVSHVDPSAPATRTFYVAVFFPTGTATAQNALQGLKTTFSIGWHVSQ